MEKRIMKKIVYTYILPSILVLFLTSCIKDSIATQYATGDQIGGSESALESMANSTAAFMYSYDYFGTLSSQEFGYPAMMIMRDALTDCPYVSTNYNHFNTPWGSLADFSSSRSKQPWRYYYRMILNANNTIIAIGDPEEHPERIQHFYGNALAYRALSYMDLTRLYEYKKTGVASLDAQAEGDGIMGLTVVVIDENFDVTNAQDNPRVPFYHMYRFIMTDLNRAEHYLQGYVRSSKIRADLSVIESLKARMWLEIATRFQKYPADLQTQLAHENDEELEIYDKLGVTSAAECYEKAAQYARKVINKYTPLTEQQWHSLTNGFNDANVGSWVFAITINSIDAVQSRVNSFHSNCVTEFSRGYSRAQYHCYRMIDKRLYDKIDDDDWRKVTWIDPADAGKKPTPEKYHTLLGRLDQINGDPEGTEWALRDAYVGFKFRPNEGDVSDDYKNALQVDYPIIRVEEMYFIEAEAKAYAEGMAVGLQALTQFLNAHRYKNASYSATPSDVDDFVDNFLLVQKRVELWGEGLSFFDIKRRELAIARGYKDTNWIPTIRYNSVPGHVPSWLNLYLPIEGETSLNKAIIPNPNPSVYDVYTLWVE